MKIKYVNEVLAMRASSTRKAKSKGTKNNIQCNDLGKSARCESVA